MRYSFYFIFLTSFFIISCQNSGKNKTETSEETIDSLTTQLPIPTDSLMKYDPSTTNDSSAEIIKNFLREENKENLSTLSEENKKFSFYEIDLNGDNENEYMVYLMGDYFCGTGGCSFYLLNHDFSINTYFTVTKPPIFRSSIKTNGWNDLILFGDKNEEVGTINYIHLKYDKTKKGYPSNPSLIKKTELAPGGHDYIMWSDDYSRAKTFSF